MFVPPATLAWLATVLFSVASVFQLLSIGSTQRLADVVREAARVSRADQEKLRAIRAEFKDAQAWDREVTGTGVAMRLMAGVLFLCWKYRAYSNLYPLQATQLRFSPVGAVGWYFCPVLNLWKPFQAMADIWWSSEPPGASRANLSFLVPLWWGLWILAPLVAVSISVFGVGTAVSGSAADAGSALHILALTRLLFVGSNIATVAVMLAISHNQSLCGQASRAAGSSLDRTSAVLPSHDTISRPKAPGAVWSLVCALIPPVGVLLPLLGLLIGLPPEVGIGLAIGFGFFFFVFAIVAVGQGGKAKAFIDAYPGRFSGRTLATVGQALGAIELLGLALLIACQPFR